MRTMAMLGQAVDALGRGCRASPAVSDDIWNAVAERPLRAGSSAGPMLAAVMPT